MGLVSSLPSDHPHKTALIDVAVTSSSFNVTGGTVSNIQKVANGNYTFRLTPTAPGTVTLAMAAGLRMQKIAIWVEGIWTGSLDREDSIVRMTCCLL